MKKLIIVLVLAGLLLAGNVAEAQPPSIPLMLEGVEGCYVNFNGEDYYPESNYLMLSGEVGDRIVITKGITKVYYYTDPMDTPMLHVEWGCDMTEKDSFTWIQRVLKQLRRIWILNT